jgi:20S proteasome alpha/beta subunit
VTIGAGFICKDGIVVASDTQESTGYAGYIKGEKLKIDFSRQNTWSIAITGAGDSNYVDMCAQKVMNSCAITDNHPCPSFHELEAIGMDIFNKHLLPLHVYPANERPVAQMLIALNQKNGRTELIEWSGSSFVAYYPYKFIGAGEQMGSHLARKMGRTTFFTSPATKVAGLAIYILDQVKATIETCGGNTDVVILQNDGRVHRIYTSQVKECEEKYRRADFGEARTLADKILSDPPNIDELF